MGIFKGFSTRKQIAAYIIIKYAVTCEILYYNIVRENEFSPADS